MANGIKHMAFRLAIPASLSLFGIVGFFCGLLAFPHPLFAHSMVSGRITIHADHPLDAQSVNRVVDTVESRLALSPFNDAEARYNVVVADSGFKKRLYFLLTPGAGGVVYYAVSGRNVFLSGVDFENGRLISQDGITIKGVRDLAYYLTHEISHLQTGAHTGVMQYVLMPEWVREGVADYIALGQPRQTSALREAVLQRKSGLSHWNLFGFYADYRFVVSHFLQDAGWNFDQLLSTRITYAEALAKARAHTLETRFGDKP